MDANVGQVSGLRNLKKSKQCRYKACLMYQAVQIPQDLVYLYTAGAPQGDFPCMLAKPGS